MRPHTVHRVTQELRHFRELLTAELKWTLALEHSEFRRENEARIAFWRDVLNEAERKISSGQISRFSAQSQGRRVS
jgi:hypothetical protein